jgi:putative oxidoreductase
MKKYRKNMRVENSKCCSVTLLFGRILISIPFLVSGLGKIFNYDMYAQYMASKGMTLIPFFLISAIIIELLGALSLISGFKARWGALLLFLFLIPTTLIFHDFWNVEGAAQQDQMFHFLKNIAIMGGLLYVASIGPGLLSLDCGCHEKRCCATKEERL